MPRETTAPADKAAQPQFPAELLEPLIPGPVTLAELEAPRNHQPLLIKRWTADSVHARQRCGTGASLRMAEVLGIPLMTLD